jgi:nitrite reductase/ring-hydroxylating ferredoxin subunit
VELGVFLVGGSYRAYRNVCPHEGAPVCRGTISGTVLPSGVYEYRYDEDRKVLRCPWHGWEFDLSTGRHLVDPGVRLRSYQVEAADGMVYVVLPR